MITTGCAMVLYAMFSARVTETEGALWAIAGALTLLASRIERGGNGK